MTEKKIAQTSRKWSILEPRLPSENSYQAIAEYLINSNKAAITYYTLVSLCGLIGFLFIGVLFIMCDREVSWTIKLAKAFPACIYSGLTVAFGQLEIHLRKKKLYQKLGELASREANLEDWYRIASDYKSWTWSEFQNIFK